MVVGKAHLRVVAGDDPARTTLFIEEGEQMVFVLILIEAPEDGRPEPARGGVFRGPHAHIGGIVGSASLIAGQGVLQTVFQHRSRCTWMQCRRSVELPAHRHLIGALAIADAIGTEIDGNGTNLLRRRHTTTGHRLADRTMAAGKGDLAVAMQYTVPFPAHRHAADRFGGKAMPIARVVRIECRPIPGWCPGAIIGTFLVAVKGNKQFVGGVRFPLFAPLLQRVAVPEEIPALAAALGCVIATGQQLPDTGR